MLSAQVPEAWFALCCLDVRALQPGAPYDPQVLMGPVKVYKYKNPHLSLLHTNTNNYSIYFPPLHTQEAMQICV